MFVNFTNHPSEVWGEKQTYEARKFGEIIDIPFPEVDPYADENMIEKLSEEYLQKMIDEGVEVTYPTDETMEELKIAAAKIYDEADSFGWSEGLYDTVRAAMGAE